MDEYTGDRSFDFLATRVLGIGGVRRDSNSIWGALLNFKAGCIHCVWWWHPASMTK